MFVCGVRGRYVDDLFAPVRAQNAKHALACLASLIRALLGSDSLQEKKMDVEPRVKILGLIVSFQGEPV